MSNQKLSYNFLPAFIIGLIEGVIVILALYCFLMAKGMIQSELFTYSGIAVIFIALLLGAGAYYTRKEELRNNSGESKIMKIYQALDIEDRLKKAMLDDTMQENKAWEKEWQEGGNATSSLSPRSYAAFIFWGFITGGIMVLLNNYIMNLPDYRALFIPFVLLAVLGFFKYRLSQKNPLSGMLMIALSGMIAAFGAYYAGGLFH